MNNNLLYYNNQNNYFELSFCIIPNLILYPQFLYQKSILSQTAVSFKFRPNYPQILSSIIYFVLINFIIQQMGKKNAITSMEAQKQKNQASSWKWTQQKSVAIGSSSGIKSSEKIASFDMDDTIIRVKSGAKFAKNADDWIFWHQSVPKKMLQLQNDGFKIVIFTNQMGVSTGKSNLNDLKKKIQKLAKEMQIQLQAFLALEDDQFRKPGTKMWDLLDQNNDGIKINKKLSFYCGDAAGRKDGKHKDFSDSDLKFGLNIGIQFLTPENLYLGETQKVTVQGFNPKSIPEDGQIIIGKTDISKIVEYVEKEMIIFVGSPGSGKSTFWKNYLSKYVRVNRDTLKTKQKCYKVAQEEIIKGNSVIIDNTNPKKDDRAYFIGLAKKHGIKIRCFRFMTPKEICFHNDYQRVCNEKRKHLSGKAGSVPIHTFFKYVQEPELGEGFYEIHQVNFMAKFNDEEDREAYHQFSKK